MPNDEENPVDYTPEDIESLDSHARSILLTIARQTNVINQTINGEDGDGEPVEHPRKNTGEDIATTRTVREATGLGRDKVNYRFRVLAGDVNNGCNPPLIETSLPPIQEDGRTPPKHLSLTPAGEAAVRDEVVDVDLAPNMPEWITSEDVTEQIETIAHRLDKLNDHANRTRAVLNVFAQNLGFTSIEALADRVDHDENVTREDVLADARAAGEFSLRDEPIIETLAVMYQGMDATEDAVAELGGSPGDHYTPPREIADRDSGGETN
jgi:predicted transcriptional regulator